MNQQNKSFQLNGENVYAGRLEFRYCQRFINIGPPNALSSSLLQYISAAHVDELICYMRNQIKYLLAISGCQGSQILANGGMVYLLFS